MTTPAFSEKSAVGLVGWARISCAVELERALSHNERRFALMEPALFYCEITEARLQHDVDTSSIAAGPQAVAIKLLRAARVTTQRGSSIADWSLLDLSEVVLPRAIVRLYVDSLREKQCTIEGQIFARIAVPST